jgi:hypothetical protein
VIEKRSRCAATLKGTGVFLRQVWRIVGCCLAGLSAAANASGQTVASSFDQLSVVAHYGDTVRLVDANGHEIRGMIYRVTDSLLEVDVIKTGMASWHESDIREIRRRINDPLTNGARNGLIVGGLLGLVAGRTLRNTNVKGILPLSIAVYGGLGACAGAAIDAMVTRDELIYARAPSTSGSSTFASSSTLTSPSLSSSAVTVSPLVTRDAKGMVVTLRF